MLVLRYIIRLRGPGRRNFWLACLNLATTFDCLIIGYILNLNSQSVRTLTLIVLLVVLRVGMIFVEGRGCIYGSTSQAEDIESLRLTGVWLLAPRAQVGHKNPTQAFTAVPRHDVMDCYP